MRKYLFAVITLALSLVCFSISAYAAEISITSFEEASAGKVKVTCGIQNESDNQRISVISCEVNDETHTEDVVFIDEITPEIAGGSFSFEFEPAEWVTYNKDYILRIGGTDITEPAELVVVYTNSAVVIAGDVNGDSKVNMRDVIALRQYLAGYDVTVDEEASDANGDNKVNMRDVIILRQYLAGYDVTLK